LGEGECNVFSWFKIGALVGFLLTRWWTFGLWHHRVC
jgi:hypothetical protein